MLLIYRTHIAEVSMVIFHSFKSKGLNSGYVVKENPEQQHLTQKQNDLF